jgi:hypothetical protein
MAGERTACAWLAFGDARTGVAFLSILIGISRIANG